jgi:3-oxoacyl-[acyl-carrier protein] reductase
MRIALITGGASGLGLASARRLAEDGLTVAVADLNADAAIAAAAQLPRTGHMGLGLDVTSEASVSAAFDAVQRQIGAVSVLACFAGILSTSTTPGRLPTTDITLAEWDAVMEVNARGSFLCIREMLRRVNGQPVEHGRIITVASLAGQIGGLQSGAAYSASKGAVLALSKVAAREAAPLGITVNTISPGPIDTPMLHRTVPPEQQGQKYLGTANVPLGRIGLPEEIAAALGYLVSPGAAFVTGATLDVNGGMAMR